MVRHNGNRRHISPEVKRQMVHMLAYLSPRKVARYHGVGVRTVQRVYALWASTGHVVRRRMQDGRPRVLSGIDAAYLESCVARTPDIYLDELQEMLLEGRHKEVSLSTISRTLYRRGWRRKQVREPTFLQCSD
ncbi:Homeodomain-like protein [Fomitopsis serialis]|uniref:Homeodomain-like protein n=1 Tax=Fomitopsis serialis TaxID=139415 RepID=UPI002008B36D|nr:Homeodomain-like protein [Neoantrodia serialis]KAH9936516.1 Homeodomain-like protein [Neoantrodia serialis]